MSENVHKFVELSQRIVVEKSVIQKYEEETARNSLNRIKSTQEISLQNYNRITMTSSSSASNVNSKLPSIDKLDNIQHDTDASTSAAGITNGDVTTDVKEKNNLDHGFSNNQLCANKQIKECVTTMTMTQQKKTISSKITTSGGNLSSTCNDGNGNDNKTGDVLSNFSITKLPPPEVTMQRPLKPQTEMDFSVPYNIINNYFSVGVVSIIQFNLFYIINIHITGKRSHI